ncbi:MAG: hypothetical protein Q4C34_09550 [Bacteroidales bacterium]|nr:hypothetical protein [Bacteroidales bacterium]
MEFDETDAIRYIREHIDTDTSARYDDDELLNLIDIVYDYYEANGMLDIDLGDDDDDDELDIDDLMNYVTRMLRKDRASKLTPEDARPMVEAYLDYEDSLD